jgi:hypothetical protein
MVKQHSPRKDTPVACPYTYQFLLASISRSAFGVGFRIPKGLNVNNRRRSLRQKERAKQNHEVVQLSLANTVIEPSQGRDNAPSAWLKVTLPAQGHAGGVSLHKSISVGKHLEKPLRRRL